MQYTAIKTMLATTGLPVTYYSWPEKQAPALPYLVWYLPMSDNIAADDKVYKKRETLNVELYTRRKDFKTEATVEEILDRNEMVWDKTEDDIPSENLYRVIYEMEILIDG